MSQLILFSGSDCHLCDVAKSLLANVELIDFELETIDVKAQREYFHEYGARIPVLRRGDTGAELPWPFDQAQLVDYLK